MAKHNPFEGKAACFTARHKLLFIADSYDEATNHHKEQRRLGVKGYPQIVCFSSWKGPIPPGGKLWKS